MIGRLSTKAGNEHARPARGARALALAALVIAGPAAHVQAQAYRVRSYTVGEGLPVGEVSSLAQDGGGRMWFATRAGLSVYDGVSWELVHPPGWSKEATPCALRTDAGGGVWVLACGGWPFVAGFDSERWWSPPFDEAVIPSDASAAVFDVARTRDGAVSIAVGTNASGLLLWSGGRWRRFGDADGLPGRAVRAVAAWGERFAVATDAALCLIGEDGVDCRPGTVLGGLAGDVVALATGRRDAGTAEPLDLWMATTRQTLHLEGGELRAFGPGLSGTDVAGRPSFHAVLRADPPHAVYAGEPWRLRRLDLRSGTWEPLGIKQGLVGDGATDVLVDREGNLWVATLRGASKLVSRRFASLSSMHGALEDEVTAICEIRPGTVVLGHNTGLTILAGDDRRLLRFPVGPTAASHRVMDLRADGRGGAWVAASSLGLGHLDERGRLRWYDRDAGASEHLYAVTVGRDGTVWTGGVGLFRLTGDRLAPVLPAEAFGAVRRLLVLADGALAIATSARGLVVLRGGALSRVPGPGSPGMESVYTVAQTRDGTTWVGTRAGLLRLAGDRLVAPDEPLVAIAPVFLIEEDRDGALWLGTDNGVVHFDGASARRFRIPQGLAGRETNRAAALVDAGGRVWIGTESGVSIYRRDDDLPPRAPPIVELLGARLGDTTLPIAAPLEFSAPVSSLEFSFRAVSFVDESAVAYRYRVEGLDPRWSSPLPANERAARITHLPPGRYRFQVKAANAEGTWSQPVSSAWITVLPPIWQRWWARALLFAALAAIAVLAARIAVEHRYARALEDRVSQRTVELVRRDAILEAITHGAEELLRVGDWESGIRHLLERLGAAAGVSRTYVFENELGEGGELLTSQRFEWAAPGVEPQIDNREMQRFSYAAAGFSNFPSMLGRGEVIASHVADMPAPEREVLGAQAIVSILVAPIFVAGQWWGSVGFDECIVRRTWTEMEIGALRLAADLIAAAIARREADEALRASEQQLRASQRMEAVGRLAGGVAHDFNNLLQAMLGAVQLLALRYPSEPGVATSASELSALVKRAAALTRQLLVFARRDMPRPETLDLNQVVDSAAAFLRRLVRANVRFTIQTTPGALPLRADPGQLEQVLTNLVVNAVDAMPDGGDLTIRTGQVDGAAWFEVCDNGPGIPPELQRKVFEPFYTTKEAGKGTGLGLSVVDGIVTQHGGRIELTSLPGRGAAFRVVLPTAETGCPAAAAEGAAAAPAVGLGERILVVEDDPALRGPFGEILRGLGYEVALTASAEEAAALPDKRPFDLLLTDHMLPGATGVDLAARLRVRWPHLKVILISGYAADDVLRHDVRAGSVRFLQKPVDIDTLAREVRAALDEAPSS